MSVATSTPAVPASNGVAGAARGRHPAWAVSILLLGGIAYVGLFVSAVVSADSELLQGLTIAPILFACTIPIALRVAKSEGDPSFATIILAGASAKLLMAYVQFQIAYNYYDGQVDAAQYHDVGSALAPAYRRLDFTTNIGQLVGTGYVKVIAGLVYAIVGTSGVAGFMVFGWFGFLGLVLLARAFRIGIPNGDHRRYMIALLFLPSLLYWPATIGKEALMLLGIGLCAYGIARILRSQATGVIPGAGGLFLVLLIRPHMALIIFAGLGFAVLIRRAPARNFAAPIFRLFGVTVLIALAFFLLSKTTAFLDTNLKSTSLTDQLTETQENTSEAGSSFAPAVVNTPLDIPWATVTVLFRPFPQEADSFAVLLSAAEGLVLAGLLVASAGRIRSVPRMIRTTPYLGFALGYLGAFVIAFSRFANFGILARQRVQVIPFVLVLIALPKFRDLIAPEPAAGAAAQRDATPVVPAGPAPRPTGTRRRLRPVRDRTAVSSGAGFGPPPRATD